MIVMERKPVAEFPPRTRGDYPIVVEHDPRAHPPLGLYRMRKNGRQIGTSLSIPDEATCRSRELESEAGKPTAANVVVLLRKGYYGKTNMPAMSSQKRRKHIKVAELVASRGGRKAVAAGLRVTIQAVDAWLRNSTSDKRERQILALPVVKEGKK